MSNRDTSAALEYHEATKLAYINLRNKPPMYKSYASGPVISLPEQFPHPSTPTLDALIPATGESAPSLELDYPGATAVFLRRCHPQVGGSLRGRGALPGRRFCRSPLPH